VAFLILKLIMMNLSINEVTERAILKAQKKGINKALEYIDITIPLPTCPIAAAKAQWQRDQVKENLQAAMRQTKTTGPTLTK